jgi:hypothetical protein
MSSSYFSYDRNYYGCLPNFYRHCAANADKMEPHLSATFTQVGFLCTSMCFLCQLFIVKICVLFRFISAIYSSVRYVEYRRVSRRHPSCVKEVFKKYTAHQSPHSNATKYSTSNLIFIADFNQKPGV